MFARSRRVDRDWNKTPAVPGRVWPSRRRDHCRKEWLCRFKVPAQPQCGQGDCLREKVARSTPGRRAQNEKADGTSALAARTKPGSSSFFDGTPDGATRLNGIMERGRTALTALYPHCHRKLDRIYDANSAQNTALLTTALRHLTTLLARDARRLCSGIVAHPRRGRGVDKRGRHTHAGWQSRNGNDSNHRRCPVFSPAQAVNQGSCIAAKLARCQKKAYIRALNFVRSMFKSTFVSRLFTVTLIAFVVAFFWALAPIITPLFGYLHPTNWTGAGSRKGHVALPAHTARRRDTMN